MARARRLLLVILALWLAPVFAADDDKGMLANLISRALSSRTTRVSVGAVEGAFSSDATVRDIVLSDRDGPWLRIDKARLVWTRAALLRRRLEVDQLDIGDIEFLRRPLKTPPNPNAAAEPILPELPLKVIVKKFAIHQLGLGESLVGVPARLAISGHASLGPPTEGLDLDLEAHRLDAAGDVVAKLGFVPKSTLLSVALKVDEPAGGLLGRLANLPGLPPVEFSLQGAGPLDRFHADVDFAAGPTIGAKGAIDLARRGAGRALALDVQSRLSGLVPAMIANVFAGQTALTGGVFLADDGAVDVKGVHLVSQNARLDIEGSVTADSRADLSLHAGAIPGSPDIGKLDLNARLKGPFTQPEAMATFELENLRSSVGTIGAASASFSARPDKPLADPNARIALEADAAVKGLALVDPALRDLVGGEVGLKLRGAATPEGALDIAVFHLEGPSATIDYAGEVDAKRLHGRMNVVAPDLSRFAKFSSLALRGAAHARADLDGAPAKGVYAAMLDGNATGFAMGIPALDGFAGGTLALNGGVRVLGDGGYGFDKLALVGAHGRADVDGIASTAKAAIHADISVPDAGALDARVAGAADIAADVTGSLAKLDAAVKMSLRDGRLLDRPTPRLDLTIDGHDITGRWRAGAKFDGEVDRKPLTGGANLASQEGGGWSVDSLSLSLGSVRLDGALKLSAADLADGNVTIDAGELDDLSPLVLTRLRGGLSARAELRSDGGVQGVSVNAKSASLAVAGSSIANLAVAMKVGDLWGGALLEGRAGASRILVAGESVDDVRIVAKPGAGASDLDVKASARGLAFAARARLAAPECSLRLSELTARGRAGDIRLLSPATLQWARSGVGVDKLDLDAGGGRLVVAGSAGTRLDLSVKATSLPLSLADLASPGLGLAGKLSGEGSVRGVVAAPEGDWRLKIDSLSAPASRAAGLPALGLAGSGRLAGGRSSLDATVSAPSAGSLRATGSIPLGAAGALDVKAAGRLDLGAANNLLGASGQRASGAVAVDISVRGDFANPRVAGSATVSHGGFVDEVRGVRIEAIEAEIAARGDTIEIARFHAATPNGGTLGASGRVRLDAAAGFPGALHLTGTRAQLIGNDVVTASASLALDVDGALARNPRVSGRVDVQSIDINIPSQLIGSSRPLEGARHIDPGPTARARLAIAARAARGAKAGHLFEAALALVVSAPSRVFLRGRGVDAEFGGEIRLGGTTNAPKVDGGFDLRRGTLALLGGQLQFTRGRVGFQGDAIPELDLTAQTTTSDITAYVNVTGPADKPVFAFTSSPSLPQDEILSRILYQKSTGNLSPFQALQLANAVAQLSGRADVFDRLRKSLGVDSLDVGADSNGGATVGARKTLNDRLSLGVSSGARPEDNGVSLDYNITRHFKLQGGVDARGGSSLGAGAQWEY
jgi:translocation and assembly module TamB